MTYTIKFIDGTTTEINQEEYQFFVSSRDSFITLKRTGMTFNKSSVSMILPSADFDNIKVIDRFDQNVGITHDGINITKYYGNWVKTDSAFEDDDLKLRYELCSWDYDYYPEILHDQVKTPKEYAEWLRVGGAYLSDTSRLTTPEVKVLDAGTNKPKTVPEYVTVNTKEGEKVMTKEDANRYYQCIKDGVEFVESKNDTKQLNKGFQKI